MITELLHGTSLKFESGGLGFDLAILFLDELLHIFDLDCLLVKELFKFLVFFLQLIDFVG